MTKLPLSVEENFSLFFESCALWRILKMIETNPQDLGIASLSRRELECFNYMGRGYTIKATAKQLNLSPRTVEQYLRNIKMKVRRHSKTQLVELYWSLPQHTLQLNNDILCIA
jgi:DNA-binding CsgD family transcriptional regulator